jgi:hypothetical protein
LVPSSRKSVLSDRAWNPDRFEKSQLSKFAAQNPHSSP